MSIFKFWFGLLTMQFLRMGFDTNSNSDSSTTATTTTTNNISSEDKRIVGGDASVGVSGSGNTVYATDAGSVQAAVTLAGNVASKALDASTLGVSGVLDALKASATANQDMFNKTLSLVGSTSTATQDSFAKATEEVNGNRALVAVGIIAIAYMFTKKAA